MRIGDLVLNFSINCKYCGHNFYKVKYVKPHVGLYCSNCKKWHKWLSKQEKDKYGIVTPEDVKLNGIGTEYMFIDDVTNNEKTITQKIVDAQLLKDELRQRYEENQEDELPWD